MPSISLLRPECEAPLPRDIVPVGLAFDSAGNLFVTDWDAPLGDFKVYKFTPGGARTTFASGLNGPVSLAFDTAGNLFVGDEDEFEMA